MRSVRTPLLLVALAVLPHLGTLRNEFAQDDINLIVENPAVNGEASPWSAFARGHWDHITALNTGAYRPLAVLSLALDHRLGGGSPVVFHAVNLLLHALVVVAAWALTRRMARDDGVALAAAALFAVHPVHVEVIALSAGRLELIAALGVLVAAWLHAADCRPGRLPWAVGACLLLVAAGVALLSKESAACLPALLILIDLLRPEGPRVTPARVLVWLLVCLVIVATLALRWWVLGTVVGADRTVNFFVINPHVALGLMERLGLALRVIGFELWILLVPWRLSVDYSHATFALDPIWLHPGTFGATMAIAVLIVTAVTVRRTRPEVTFAIGWFFVSLFIVSNIAVLIGTIMAERLLYVPSLGFCLGLAIALRAGWDRSLWVGVAILVALFAARSAVRVRDFESERSLYEAAWEVNPRSAYIAMSLGDALWVEGERERGLELFRAGAAIHHDFPHLHMRMGVRLNEAGQVEAARSAFRSAALADPEYTLVWWLWGDAASRLDRHGEALGVFRQLVDRAPEDAMAWVGLGDSLWAAGERTEAREAYERSVAIDPQFTVGWHQLAVLLAESRRPQSALEAIDHALEAAPEFAEGHVMRASLLLQLDRSEEAAASAREALRLEPELEVAQELLRRAEEPENGT